MAVNIVKVTGVKYSKVTIFKGFHLRRVIIKYYCNPATVIYPSKPILSHLFPERQDHMITVDAIMAVV